MSSPASRPTDATARAGGEQIYLLDNPLLTEPLRPEHVKPRLLGHWAPRPGLNLIYAHLNRVIRDRDLDMIHCPGSVASGPAGE